jgi:short-subunit dehydrogenase involved in D-alanine esterification of teichoic acids
MTGGDAGIGHAVSELSREAGTRVIVDDLPAPKTSPAGD